MEPESLLHQHQHQHQHPHPHQHQHQHPQLSASYRSLQPQAAQALQHGQPHLNHHTLASQAGLDLSGLDDSDFQQDLHRLQNASHASVFHTPNAYDHSHGHRHIHSQGTASPHTPQQHVNNAQFGILSSGPVQHNSIGRLQQEEDLFGSPDGAEHKGNGHPNAPLVVDPPNLDEWRLKLFNVDEMITLSEEEFNTYFAHVDNVYSHRSTQRYKRKPFVSHYWDCRLKGLPPGTPKSDDPNKKKRKRTARERDLCDVKIKITEYFPGAMLRPDFVPDGATGPEGDSSPNFFPQQHSGSLVVPQQPFEMLGANDGIPSNHPGSTGDRYYTIQRVNGNGGNGKGDGVAGPHKHSLEDSDKVKKNSVQRLLMKRDKEERKTQKTYHKKCSGAALTTVRKHSKEADLKLFGSCFCPFAQRVWITLEAKGLTYQYIEVDPYRKPQALLEVNPRGLVPALRHGDWGCGESTVLMEYIEDLGVGVPLLPMGNPQLRATCRLWVDHINRNITPAFYQLLQAQDFQKQAECTKKLQEEIGRLVDASNAIGPYFLGSEFSFVDIQFAPWMLLCSRVLKYYRSWPDPEPGSRWERWLHSIENNEHVKATTSADELYVDSYERYAQNRPGTSQLADAVNGGYGLP